jgi:pimeloyl-ACP methyl ester carboxylesterase
VFVFCHEFLSDRFSFLPYVGELRELGYDLFTFDFRNHGESATDASYEKMQWVTDRELCDLQSALAYVRSRPDADPAGVGLFGISRGANAALCVAAQEAGVWSVITDGAFPTRGTMNVYMHRWAKIYISSNSIWMRTPWIFGSLLSYVGWATRLVVQKQRGCQLADVEKAAARLSPRPLLMIHGEKDSLIGPEIARGLFALAGDPKDLWIVPEAKHNRCRELEPEAYRERIATFVTRFGPRPPQQSVPAVPVEQPQAYGRAEPAETRDAIAPMGSGVMAPVTG